MIEIYIISILDNIRDGFLAIAIIGFIALIVSLIINLELNERKKKAKLFIPRLSCVLLIISTLGLMLVPSTKNGYMILGIGGTIDYVRSHEIASKIPDKCIKAIDIWLEDKTNKEKKDE